MLHGLKIENIAVIENVQIEFASGFNVLTGETGAGKSIVIDSINAVLGERTSKELIRDGKDSAKVTATFNNVNHVTEKLLDDYDIEKTEDGEMTISRSITLSGKNSCKINGTSVTVSQLKEIGASLINIHGQHDSQALLHPESHLSFIDSMAGDENLLSEYKSAFHKLINVKKQLDALYDSRDEKASRLEYLDFVINEIDSAAITPGEIDALNNEKTLLENSVKVEKLLSSVYNSLGGDHGLSESVMDTANDLENAASYYKEADKTSKALKSLAFELSEITSDVKRLGDEFSFSPGRLKEINDRLDVIYRLSMKYGKNEDEILSFLDKAVNEKATLNNYDNTIEELEKELFASSDKVKSLSTKLSEIRN